MTIATFQFEDIGAHIYGPEGPFGVQGNTPMPSFKPGTVVGGDNGAEFIFLLLDVVAGLTLNQGDVVCWDQTMNANPVASITTTGEYDVGCQVGTLFLGGRAADAAAAPSGGNVWSFTFTPGQYGIWVQRAGVSLANILASATKTLVSTSGLGRVNFLAAAAGGNAIAAGSIAFMPTSKTFTANTTSGTATLTAANVGKYLQVGMIVTGAGIPAAPASPSTVIIAINGAVITLSANATATAAGVTITALTNSTSGNTTNLSTALTSVQSITGFYPNQTIAGTGIPASTTITSITGNGVGGYTINLSAAATATASNISFTTTAMPNYSEVMLSWPYYIGATV